MHRSLLAFALCVFAGQGAAMTATLAPTSQQTPSAPGATAGGGSSAGATNKTTSPSATQSSTTATPTKTASPSAASVIKPAAVLSAPGVPMKAAAAPAGKAAGVRDKETILPGGASKSAPASSPASAAWATTARGGAAIRRGTVENMNMSAATFQVYGQKLSFNPQRVKVFDRNGRPASIYTLKSGAKVRFTFDTTDPAQRRVAVIYVD